MINSLNDYSISKNEANIKAKVKGTSRFFRGNVNVQPWRNSLVIAMVIMLTESITKPLKKGVVMMQELKRGHLSKRLHLNRKDEIGELTDAMDEFADNLQKNIVFNMQQISEGNIDIAPDITDDKDEIGPALNKMINAIGLMSDEIR